MGGAERVALDLATVQQEQGHDVCVLCLSDSALAPMASEFASAGITVHDLVKRPGLDYRLPWEVGQRLRELGAQVAHTHNTQPLVYAAAASRIAGLVVVHTKHGEGHLVSKMGQFLRRLGSPFVHSFVAVSEKTAEHARAQWAYPIRSRIRVIPNGIRVDKHNTDSEARRKIRKELGIPEDAQVVLTVGRCDPNKNQAALVRICDSLLSPDFHLVFAGSGESLSELQEVASACSLPDSVHILGSRQDIPSLMAAADVFALPSLSEGLPLVLLEAMACQLPVVCSAVGGIPDVVNNSVGILVSPEDESVWTEALTLLSGNKGMAHEMGIAGRALVQEQYSASRMSDAYVELYRNAMR
ncbi:MAG: glycosyltransferase [Kofleriaceae bacterium]|nr:glycosyltransferase [Kofleriaceae bacterium]